MKQRVCLSAFLAVSAFIAASCGGSSSSTTPAGNSLNASLGSINVQYHGTPSFRPNASFASGQVTVTGLGGASITTVSATPVKALGNTHIAFARGGQIWVIDNATQEVKEITSLTGNQAFSGGPSWSPSGQLVFSTALSNGTPTNTTYTCYYDGSNLTKLPAGSNTVVQMPSWSPDGTHIAGYNATGDLCVESSSGGSTKSLASHTGLGGVFTVSWLNATTVVFQEPVAGVMQLFKVPSAGGTVTQLAGFNNATSGTYDLMANVSLDGSSVAYNSGGATDPHATVVNLTGSSVDVTAQGFDYSGPGFSPNNNALTFWGGSSGQTSNDGTFGIYTSQINGEGATLVASDPIGGAGPQGNISSFPRWQPFLPTTLLVGSGGMLGSSSSGVFLSQKGDEIAALASFVATTPSTVVVTPPSAVSPGAALAFSVAADAITRVAWMNGYNLPSTSVSPTGTKTFVISFSGSSGNVTIVAPLAVKQTRSVSARLQPEVSATTYTYKADFAGVYDGQGHNLAPTGATTLVINRKTGKLVSVR
ncbi:MAG TPA: hypothetical protein VG944_00630 [Fimbriimonas sp.]|nr:hypothetical protein [Fimbriimonas sp.]